MWLLYVSSLFFHSLKNLYRFSTRFPATSLNSKNLFYLKWCMDFVQARLYKRINFSLQSYFLTVTFIHHTDDCGKCKDINHKRTVCWDRTKSLKYVSSIFFAINKSQGSYIYPDMFWRGFYFFWRNEGHLKLQVYWNKTYESFKNDIGCESSWDTNFKNCDDHFGSTLVNPKSISP